MQGRGALFVCVCLWSAAPAAAQTPRPANPYRQNAADEDWTFLKTAKRTDVWDPIKYIPLGPEDWSLTLSGELRWRPEGFRVRETAARAETIDNYLLQRYLIGADLRLGLRARVFGELQSGLVNGKFQSPRPTDRNPADLHQAFFAWSQPLRQADRLTVTVGRQEIEIGSSRLISASPGLNVKRSFDGIVAVYKEATWTFAGVGAELVGLHSGTFDDRPDNTQQFWGAAAARKGPVFQRSDVGAYYLGIRRSDSTFAQGAGEEVRHTIGGRWNGAGQHFDLNYDVLFQWGDFVSAPIRAWAFATETGYRLTTAPWSPRVSVRTDIASGDRDAADAELQSFNPLFPGNSYSGSVGLLGPTNLTDVTPAVTLSPRRGLVISVEAPSYWRTSTGDAVYSTSLRVLFGPAASPAKYVGTNPGVAVVWQATRHLQFQGVITRFLSGTFLDQTFVSSGFGFYSFSTRYRF